MLVITRWYFLPWTPMNSVRPCPKRRHRIRWPPQLPSLHPAAGPLEPSCCNGSGWLPKWPPRRSSSDLENLGVFANWWRFFLCREAVAGRSYVVLSNVAAKPWPWKMDSLDKTAGSHSHHNRQQFNSTLFSKLFIHIGKIVNNLPLLL